MTDHAIVADGSTKHYDEEVATDSDWSSEPDTVSPAGSASDMDRSVGVSSVPVSVIPGCRLAPTDNLSIFALA